MKLEEWLKKNNVEFVEFSKRINSNRMTLYNWRKGHFSPNRFFQELIHKETNGEVSFNDWGNNEIHKRK
jgi:hypothetical protein